MSVLQSIRSFNVSHPLVTEICNWLIQNASRYRIIFCWVPGHVGVLGNEKADLLARLAHSVFPENSALPFRDYFPSIRKYIFQLWQNEWDDCSSSKLYKIKNSIHFWPSSLHRMRSLESMLTTVFNVQQSFKLNILIMFFFVRLLLIVRLF